VHNQLLFRALISCLSSSPADLENETRSFPGNPTRKRTLSISEMPDSIASKSLKISHSPQVGKRTFAYGRPQINVKVLAATILYVSFEHLDHWPVTLIKAYSEDCFGPRSWVDEPACQLLVRNLALSHAADSDSDSLDPKKETDALAVADFFLVKETTLDTTSYSPVRQLQRGSLSSISSHPSVINAPVLSRPRSMSTESFDSVKPNDPKKPKVITATSKMSSVGTMNADDSDSGEEEEVAVTPAVGKKSDDGDSSSSGEEDEEVVVKAKKSRDDESFTMTSPNSKTTDQPPRLKLTYPYTQEYFNFDKVRQRYFGINLDHAHLAISTSLNERLDVKSKQNSGLLQTLPSFTAIPAVRSLITANLEKWLQSPALAGLGRSLFSTTVGMMKNVDPPLPADLEAIDNILGMKLKVNQVRIVSDASPLLSGFQFLCF
jgi:integrator complex subunit 1